MLKKNDSLKKSYKCQNNKISSLDIGNTIIIKG